jgi:hypothetical protein
VARGIDIILVTFAVFAFAAFWLPKIGVYALQPIAGPILLADFLCGILLIVRLLIGRRRKL